MGIQTATYNAKVNPDDVQSVTRFIFLLHKLRILGFNLMSDKDPIALSSMMLGRFQDRAQTYDRIYQGYSGIILD